MENKELFMDLLYDMLIVFTPIMLIEAIIMRFFL